MIPIRNHVKNFHKNKIHVQLTKFLKINLKKATDLKANNTYWQVYMVIKMGLGWG